MERIQTCVYVTPFFLSETESSLRAVVFLAKATSACRMKATLETNKDANYSEPKRNSKDDQTRV